MLQENRPEMDGRSFFNKSRTRRQTLVLGAGALLSMSLRDTEPSAFKKIGNYAADKFSHNADSLDLIERSQGIPAIEMDMSQLPNGELVIAHSVKDYNQVPLSLRQNQEPAHVARVIRKMGAKPHVDVKFELGEDIPDVNRAHDFLINESRNGPMAVSTPHHKFLWDLHKKGFEEQILFTLRDEDSVKEFLKIYNKNDFKNGIFGVSIRFTHLSSDVSEKLKDMGLYILAWTPNTSVGILSALQNGADGITSDAPHLLRQIGKNVSIAA